MVVEGILYTETHEWVKVEGNEAYIGITDYAQHELGDIVFVELPDEGDEVDAGGTFGSVEAVKAVEDLISPISGEIIEINEDLSDQPELLNTEAFEGGWLIKIKISDPTELEKLLDSKKYQELIEE